MSTDQQDQKPVVRIGSITLGGETFDLAMNGRAVLAEESKDIYGRPAAMPVDFDVVAGEDLGVKAKKILQELLDQLAACMKERDAALQRLHKTGDGNSSA